MSNASQVISSLDQTISTFRSRVDVKVQDVHSSTTNIRATTDRIYENISKFKTDMMHGEEKQIAHENILRIDQIIKEQFSNHVAIRRTVMGVVRDFDINLVRNSTIQELSEELWITSSRYWLSYALIAITAWVNDYPEVAKNALAECGRRDRIKTTLFFCLMNLRFDRVEVAKKWFFEYLRTLDPTILQQETAILLQSFLNGVFGKDKELEHEVIELIDQWITEINEDAEISAELLREYEQFIANTNPQVKFEYESLSRFCTNAGDLQKSYTEVSKYDKLIAFAKSLDVEAGAQTDINYKSRIDSILNDLISNYDKEELELKNQQEYFRFIIENNGEVDKAEAQYEELQKLQNKSFNIGRQMVKWALYDGSEQTDVQVRKFGFQNTKAWFKSAVSNWSAKMKEAFPLEYSLRIDIWSGESNGRDEAEMLEGMKKHYENNQFQLKYVNSYNIAAVIVFFLSIAFAFLTPFSLVITALSLGFLVYRVLNAEKAYAKRLNEALENLRSCMSEIAEFRNYFESNQVKKDNLMSIVEFI